jgi:hypothetical protein
MRRTGEPVRPSCPHNGRSPGCGSSSSVTGYPHADLAATTVKAPKNWSDFGLPARRLERLMFLIPLGNEVSDQIIVRKVMRSNLPQTEMISREALIPSPQANDGQRPAFSAKCLAAGAMIEYSMQVGTSVAAGAVWFFGAEQAVPARLRKPTRGDGVCSKYSSVVGVR